MSRITLKSPNSAVLAQGKLLNLSSSFLGGRNFFYQANLLGGVTSVSYSIPKTRQTKRQVGSCYYAADDLIRHAEVDLTIEYLFSPSMINEKLLYIHTKDVFLPSGYEGWEGGDNLESSFLPLERDARSDIYIYNHPDEESDAIRYLSSSEKLEPNGGEILSFSDCFLTNYSLSFENKSLPRVSANFKGQTLKAGKYTAPNFLNARSEYSKSSRRREYYWSVTSDSTNYENFYGTGVHLDLTDPITQNPSDLILELENVQIGGQNIDNVSHIINSMSFDIPINRISSYGLGSDRCLARDFQVPIKGSLKLSSLVDNYQTGIILDLLKNESDYNFTIKGKSCEEDLECVFRFSNVKLESYSYSMNVNEDMVYSAEFSYSLDDKSYEGQFLAGMTAEVRKTDFSKTYLFDANGDVDAFDDSSDGIVDNLFGSTNGANAKKIQFSKIPNLSIGDYVLYSNLSIEGDIEIPDNVTSIGTWFLNGCSNVNNVYLNIPESSVGVNSFLNGPTGTLYIGCDYIDDYGEIYNGMPVAVWDKYTCDLVTVPDPVYTITPDSDEIAEGSNLRFAVNVQNLPQGQTIYWKISNNQADFQVSQGGPITLDGNGDGEFFVTPEEDLTSEGIEFFNASLVADNVVNGEILKTSSPVSILDTSLSPPVYNVYARNNINNVNEGGIFWVDIITQNVPNGTLLYWSVSEPGQFEIFEGQVPVNNQKASFYVTPKEDLTDEGDTFFNIDIVDGDSSPIGSLNSIKINDTSVELQKFYSISAQNNVTSVDEGQSLQFNITTTNVTEGTILYWDVTNAGDIDDPSSGQVVVDEFGETQFSVIPTPDALTEELPESFIARIYEDPIPGPDPVASSLQITINDTSQGVSEDYSISVGSNQDELNSINAIVTTANVAPGTLVNWEIEGIGGSPTNASDFLVSSGSFNLDSESQYNLTIIPVADSSVNEGDETFVIVLKNTLNQEVARSISINLADTSQQEAQVYTATPGADSVEEGSSLIINVTTENVDEGTVINWEVDRPEDFNISSGQETIDANGNASFFVSPKDDIILEGEEDFIVIIKDNLGQTAASTSLIAIIDTTEEQVLFRINCGSSNTINALDPPNIDWFGDDNSFVVVNTPNGKYSGVTSNVDSSTNPPPAYTPREIFTSDRWALTQTWTFIVPENGKHAVNLYFSETFWKAGVIGYRLFDVFVNGDLFLASYDRFAEGDNSLGVASFQSYEVDVTNNEIIILLNGVTENSAINGIEIIKIPDVVNNDPVYNLSSADNVDEGSNLTVSANFENVSDTTYWWRAANINPSQLDASEGQFTTVNGSATFNITPTEDQTTEDPTVYTFSVIVSATQGGAALQQIDNITINDTSQTPASPVYTITTPANDVDEGQNLLVTVTTQNVSVPTTLNWNVTPTNQFDIFEGTVSIDVTEQGTFNVNPKEDQTTEGPISFNIYLENQLGDPLQNKVGLTINDTSKTPPEYTISAGGVTQIDEGSNLAVTITTTDVDEGTVLYWSLVLSNDNDPLVDDFQTQEGSYSVPANGIYNFDITPVADTTTESNESFSIQLFTDPSRSIGSKVDELGGLTIVDTSQGIPSYVITTQGNVTQINEGEDLIVVVTTTNVLADTELFWSVTNGSSQFVQSQGSIFVEGDGVTEFSVTPKLDQTTEPDPFSFTVDVKKDSQAGQSVGSTANIDVIDTSQDPDFDEVIEYRINFGGPTATALDAPNIDWAVDTNTNPSQYRSSPENNTHEVSDTRVITPSTTDPYQPPAYTPLGIYTSARWDAAAVEYTFPVENNANYRVNCYFSEIYTSLSKPRIIDVIINENLALNNVDVYALSNNTFDVGLVLNHELTVTNSEIKVRFLRDPDSQPTSDYENVSVNALEIIKLETNISTYEVIGRSNSVNEGSSLTFDVTTTNVNDGTLYWSVSGVSASNDDFVDVTGSVDITTSAGEFNVQIASDLNVETNETFYAILQTGIPVLNTYNDKVGQSQEIAIGDGTIVGNWVQLGDAILDSNSQGNEKLGWAVSLSDDGSRVAIGTPYQNVGSNGNAGKAEIYEYINNNWSQIGPDITGPAGNDECGTSLAMSSSNRIVVGYRDSDLNGVDSGMARVFEYNGSSWAKLGNDIGGVKAYDYFGVSSAISSDGNVVIVGGNKYDNGADAEAGYAEIYEYDPLQNPQWVKIGSSIFGGSAGDQAGSSVAISADGSIIAIGAEKQDQNGADSGVVRAFIRNGNSWDPRGNPIYGSAAGDRCGKSCFLSDDGNTLVIGYPGRDDAGINSLGLVRVFYWDGNDWQPKGNDILGVGGATSEFGHGVAMSADGNIIAGGAPLGDNGADADSGYVKAYSWDGTNWNPLGETLFGISSNDKLGFAVSLSADGSTLASGEIQGGGGRVYVWKLQ